MLKVLVKKQFMEVFKGYFYNAKKNKSRSKLSITLYFVLFAVIMVVLLGGIFGGLSYSMCSSLYAAGADWLYFLILSSVAIFMGVFGSVFNTYQSLYLAKDNDLLLSMPISEKDIILSRLVNVYILGAMYSFTAIIPALVVYWITVGASISNVICGIILAAIISIFVLILSCVLGWFVAIISQKVKNKSFVTVILSIGFIAIYYLFYFKAQELITDLIENVLIYGNAIKSSAYVLYLFGCIGTGNWVAAGIYSLVIIALLMLTMMVLNKTFISIATTEGPSDKKKYVRKSSKQKSAFAAMVSKELNKFTSSPNYMLNCGLGILFIPIAGILLLLKGEMVIGILSVAFSTIKGAVAVIIGTLLITLLSMIDIAVPSVSLEGKNIWILQSLPIEPRTILRAKTFLQLVLSIVPMSFLTICVLIALNESIITEALLVLFILLATIFSSLFSSFLGVKMANLTWTNEIIPIKQSGASLIAIFGGWAEAVIFAAAFFFKGYIIGVDIYFAIWIVIFAVASIVLFNWLENKGAKIFSEL